MQLRWDSIRHSIIPGNEYMLIVLIQAISLAKNTTSIKWLINDDDVWFDPNHMSEYCPFWIDVRENSENTVKAVDNFGNEALMRIVYENNLLQFFTYVEES